MNAPSFSIVVTCGLVSVRLLLLHGMAALWLALLMFLPRTSAAAGAPVANASAIPLDQIGATAEKQYSGDGLSVWATDDGARLRCVFQKMEGEVTREGLWLTSTAEESNRERFRVVATAVGRAANEDDLIPFCVAQPSRLRVNGASPPRSPFGDETSRELAGECALLSLGSVEVAGNVARFIRPGLTEEYRVSMDGVQQDFVIAQRPDGRGQVRVELAVTGATVEPLANGARLVLEGSGRRLNYNRLRVTDAAGKELPARMEVHSSATPESLRGNSYLPNPNLNPNPHSLANAVQSSADFQVCRIAGFQTRAPAIALLVDDTAAVYPVRIDPTFSDADWFSLGGIAGADSSVYTSVLDGSGNLYVGGSFTVIGEVVANGVAKWDGNAWSPLGSGMDNSVLALAVSGSDLYAGGSFITAGGVTANRIAKWDGSAWSALSSGMNDWVFALAMSGSDLYAGGWFTTAGGVTATNIAKWDGSAWSALGSGMNDAPPNIPAVRALAVLGSDLYAGGNFTTAGGVSANYIAKWNGSTWSALGSGMNSTVVALAVTGSDLYAGGVFTHGGRN